MRLTTAILTAAVALAAAAPAQAQWPRYRPPYSGPNYYPQAQIPYGRHLWVYETSVGPGEFRQMPDGSWQETNPMAGFYYQEVGRNPAYVELYDPNRALNVRLYQGYLMQRNQGGYWFPGYTGYWQ
jgi:hypothetical protein